MQYFSQRTEWDLETNHLTTCIRQKQQNGVSLIDLTNANPTLCLVQYPTALISSALTKKESFIYRPLPKGDIAARVAISSYYREMNIDIHPENVFLCASTSEAYSQLFRLLANPGDEILVPSPSYPLFQYLADLADLKLKIYPLEYTEDGWIFDPVMLEKSISLRTRAIILVHPNNPTGNFVDRSSIESLIRIAKEHRLSLICDEVFYDYCFKDSHEPALSFAALREVPTYTLNGFSKMLGLPQLKLSWIVINGPDQVIQEAIARLEMISDTYLSVNTPVQVAAPTILKMRKGIQEQIKKLLEDNRDILRKLVKQVPACEYLRAQGGWVAVLRFPALMDDEAWAIQILSLADVIVHPGCFFGFPNGYCVVSLLVKNELFKIGIEKVLRVVKTYS